MILFSSGEYILTVGNNITTSYGIAAYRPNTQIQEKYLTREYSKVRYKYNWSTNIWEPK